MVHKTLDEAISLLDATFTPKNLEDHYNRHKTEFGNISKSKYAKLAQKLSEGPRSKGVIEYKRKNGEKVRYNLNSGELIIWNVKSNKVITLFKPKYDPRTHTIKTTANKEYVRKDMIANGKKPPF